MGQSKTLPPFGEVSGSVFTDLVMQTVNTVGAEVGLAALDSFLDLVGDGFFGNTHTRGYLIVGKTFKFAEDNYFIAALGKRGHGIGEEGVFFLSGEDIGGIGDLVYNVRGDESAHGINWGTPVMPEKIQSKITGGLEEEGLNRGDGLGRLPLPETKVGLLHEVVDFMSDCRKLAAEP